MRIWRHFERLFARNFISGTEANILTQAEMCHVSEQNLSPPILLSQLRFQPRLKFTLHSGRNKQKCLVTLTCNKNKFENPAVFSFITSHPYFLFFLLQTQKTTLNENLGINSKSSMNSATQLKLLFTTEHVLLQGGNWIGCSQQLLRPSTHVWNTQPNTPTKRHLQKITQKYKKNKCYRGKYFFPYLELIFK